MNEHSWKDKLLHKSKWVRALFMIFFVLISFFIKLIVWFITAFQLIMVLFTDKPNKRLIEFSQSLSLYAYQIIRFLTYISEKKPYPFDHWPHSEERVGEVVGKK